MNINFGRLSLTNEHPASHYGAGVMIDNELSGRYYGPIDVVPETNKWAKKLYNASVPESTAGELIEAFLTSGNYDLTDIEIDFIRRYLSQDPHSRYLLPDNDTIHRWRAETLHDEDIAERC
ncbi:MAG: hypothetical protein M0Z43_13605 [Acidithiobacillus sp.]|nr:hypothetical protein [Acidithiobacillus sp.]